MDTFMEDFTSELFAEAGFEPEEFEELNKELEPVIWDYILTKLIERMTPAQQNEADNMLDNDDGDGFHELCLKAIPDYDEYFAKILKDFEEYYLTEIQNDEDDEDEWEEDNTK